MKELLILSNLILNQGLLESKGSSVSMKVPPMNYKSSTKEDRNGTLINQMQFPSFSPLLFLKHSAISFDISVVF